MPFTWFGGIFKPTQQTQLDRQTRFGRQRFLTEQTPVTPSSISRRRTRLGSFFNGVGGIEGVHSETNQTWPLWIKALTFAVLTGLWAVCASSADLSFEFSSPSSLPFTFRIFTHRFDIFSDSRLPASFTWGCYTAELRLGSRSTVLSTFDYASLSVGGKAIEALTSVTYSPLARKDYAALRRIFSRDRRLDHSPAAALTDGTDPGQCWAIHGDSGQLGIQLAKAIRVTALTVGHTNMSSTTSAPKGFVLWGLKPVDSDFCAEFGGVGPPRLNFGSTLCGVRLLSGIYDPSNSQLYQNFTIDSSTPYYANSFENVIVQIVGNWGHSGFTCIYRIQVYGEVPDLS
ncbi:hypothetical protein EDB89DRAFT_1972798 [Lactarius sanguifluus]|nr:hypothetical protein EDB89DRAFT_1972798 [Lactarius sanguifluus]